MKPADSLFEDLLGLGVLLLVLLIVQAWLGIGEERARRRIREEQAKEFNRRMLDL